MIIDINSINPQKRLINKVIDVLKKGGIIAYPTDTIYGIGCNIMDKKAIDKIYKIKKIKKNTPLSFICSELRNISYYAKVSNYAYKTMKRLLPGPYTFILEASKLVPKIMLTKRKTVGIRIPNNNICKSIVENLGNPIISTSTITSSNVALSDPYSINNYFGKNIDIIIDGGKIYDKPSSVVSLIDDQPKILRKGLGDIDIFKS